MDREIARISRHFSQLQKSKLNADRGNFSLIVKEKILVLHFSDSVYMH